MALTLSSAEIRDVFMEKHAYGVAGYNWPRNSIAIVNVDLVSDAGGKHNIYTGQFDSDKTLDRDGDMISALKSSVLRNYDQIEEMKQKMDAKFHCQFIMNYSPRADCSYLLIDKLPKIFGENVRVEIYFATFYKCHTYEYSRDPHVAESNLGGLIALYKRFKLGLIDSQKKWKRLVLPYCRDLSDFQCENLLRFSSRFGDRDDVDRSIFKEKITDRCDGACDSQGIDRELEILGPDVQSFYHKACLEGSKAVHRMRLMIVGHFAAGKTSLKNSLRSLPFCPEHDTTNGIDADPLVCRVDVEDYCNWKPISSEQEKEEHSLGVAETIRRMQSLQSNDSIPPLIKYESRSQLDAKEEEKDIAATSTHDSFDGASGTQPVMMDTTEGQPSPAKRIKLEKEASQIQMVPDQTKITEVTKHYEKLDREQPENKPSDPRFSIWDFGGQTEFYETHSLFLGHRSIYLLVLNLAKDMIDIIPTERQGRLGKVPNKTVPQCAADYLEFWLNSIHTQVTQENDSSKQKPAVVMVSTHKDKLPKEKRQEAINKFYTDVQKRIERKAFSKMVHPNFFAIANNDETDDEVEELRRSLVDLAKEQPYWNEQIPLHWIDLRERLMQRKSDEIITLDAGYEIAKQVGIESQENFRKVLRFYHQLGDLVFFDEDKLRSLIVLNPQWLINAFCKVITIRKAHEQQRFPDSTEHWRNLEEYGLLHDVVLDHVWDTSKKDHLLNLMQRFGLVLPMRLCNLTDVYQEAKSPDNLYIVPSFLPPLEEEDDKNRRSAVIIAFNGGFVPTGVTNALITSLVTDQKWALHGQINHNHAVFLPTGEECPFSISIQGKSGILELRRKVLGTSEELADAYLGPYLKTILKQLQSVLNTRHCTAEFELAVRCACKGIKERKLRKIGPNGETIKGLKVLKCHGHPGGAFLTKHFSAWFEVASADKDQQCVANGNCITEEVPDKLLMEVDSRVPEWHRLGHILVGRDTVVKLTTPIQGGPEHHGMKVLMKWYNTQVPISMTQVKETLGEVFQHHKRADLAETVENYHGSNAELLFNDISLSLLGRGLWKSIAISLGLTDDDLQEISAVQMAESNPCWEMLRSWRNKTKGRHKSRLIKALRKVKRNDVASFVKKWKGPRKEPLRPSNGSKKSSD